VKGSGLHDASRGDTFSVGAAHAMPGFTIRELMLVLAIVATFVISFINCRPLY